MRVPENGVECHSSLRRVRCADHPGSGPNRRRSAQRTLHISDLRSNIGQFAEILVVFVVTTLSLAERRVAGDALDLLCAIRGRHADERAVVNASQGGSEDVASSTIEDLHSRRLRAH